MNTYKNFTEAEQGAIDFFKDNFGHDSGVGIEKEEGNKVEFYSLEDPGMDDTFICLIGE